MMIRARDRILALAIASTCGLPTWAAADPATLKDLSAAIALLGLPCGQVVSATKITDKDHVAVCQDGNRYRIFVNAKGRVVAQKQP